MTITTTKGVKINTNEINMKVVLNANKEIKTYAIFTSAKTGNTMSLPTNEIKSITWKNQTDGTY